VLFFSFVFFQAEDGIRDATVTGVQTCALPIYCLFRNHVGQSFCSGCGVPLNSPMEVASAAKRTTAKAELLTNSADALKAPVADKHEIPEYWAASAEPIAHVSWERLSHEIIAGFEGFANSNPAIHSVSRPPVAVNHLSPEPQ